MFGGAPGRSVVQGTGEPLALGGQLGFQLIYFCRASSLARPVNFPLELRHGFPQPDDERRARDRRRPALLVDGVADASHQGVEALVQVGADVSWGASDLCPAALEVTQFRLERVRIAVHIHGLRLGEQRLPRRLVGTLLLVTLREGLRPPGIERLLRGPEPLPERGFGVPIDVTGVLPLSHERAESVACRRPIAGLREAFRFCSSREKYSPRRRLNSDRAAAKRFHNSASALRSAPLISRHWSAISRSRSPAFFHWVLCASSSACSTSARLASVA